MKRRGFIVLYGPPGRGKSTAAATTFQNSLYLCSAPNILQYYDSMAANGVRPPRARRLLDQYGFYGWEPMAAASGRNGTAGEWKPRQYRADQPPAAGLIVVPQKETFEKVCIDFTRLCFDEAARGPQRTFDYLIIDEAHEFYGRVFKELGSASITDAGKQDSRKQYGLLGEWSVDLLTLVRQVTAVGVGLILIAHDQEPDIASRKKGGPKFTSQAIMRTICAMADAVGYRGLIDAELPSDPPIRLWRFYARQHDLGKIRGLSDEDARRLEREDLSTIMTAAHFDL